MKLEIKKITIKDRCYPLALKKIKDPPENLYCQGEIFSKEKCLAIIGTRKPSAYGKQLALYFSRQLSQAGLTIVSGFAPGIDSLAHWAAVSLKKRTIAVLGTGLEEKVIYPRSNLKLKEKILENNGLLISELKPQTHGTKFSFVFRNRIIAGLSLGVLIVEAKRKSGALITAQFAFSYKIPVFALPGSVYSSNSKGCHFLIKKGARLVEEPEEILEFLKIKPFKTTNREKEFNPEEIKILNLLKNGPLSFDKILEKTKISTSELAGLLAILEIKGKVKNLGGNSFGLCI
jgi:DNA processing protein